MTRVHLVDCVSKLSVVEICDVRLCQDAQPGLRIPFPRKPVGPGVTAVEVGLGVTAEEVGAGVTKDDVGAGVTTGVVGAGDGVSAGEVGAGVTLLVDSLFRTSVTTGKYLWVPGSITTTSCSSW